MLGGCLDSTIALEIRPLESPSAQGVTEDAARNYIANTKRLLETQIVPELTGGIVRIATARPVSLTVEVTDDPSPYGVGAQSNADGSLTVRLSLGYLAMHDAALDAVGVAAPLKRSRAVRDYLRYQLAIARDNDLRSARDEPRRPAMTFAEFLQLNPETVQTLFVQPQWRRARQTAQVDSLGWILAYLLVRVEPNLAGLTPSSSRSTAAARLAAASGFFPSPPFATAFELAEILRPADSAPNERGRLCRTAEFMAAGLAAVRADPEWRTRLNQSVDLQSRVRQIGSEVSRMWREARCEASAITTV